MSASWVAFLVAMSNMSRYWCQSMWQIQQDQEASTQERIKRRKLKHNPQLLDFFTQATQLLVGIWLFRQRKLAKVYRHCIMQKNDFYSGSVPTDKSLSENSNPLISISKIHSMLFSSSRQHYNKSLWIFTLNLFSCREEKKPKLLFSEHLKTFSNKRPGKKFHLKLTMFYFLKSSKVQKNLRTKIDATDFIL